MPAAQPGLFPAICSAALVADLVFLYGVFLREALWPWGYTPSAYALPAAGGGLTITIALSSGLSGTRRLAIVTAGCVCWAVAGLLSDWAGTEAILGARALPQWWVTVRSGPGCAYGFAFFSGQLIPGAVAGLGALGPIAFNSHLTRTRRLSWSLGLFIVTAVAWVATFHGTWVT